MPKVFLDTNILIDFLCKRNDFDSAASILSMGKSGDVQLYASVLTMANIVYILRKVLKGKQMYRVLRDLSLYICALPITKDNFESALKLEADDFEDALQYYSALSNKCDLIITRNCKDFPFSTCPVLLPSEFLDAYSCAD